MYRAMYERKYRQSAEQTKDTDLEEFIWQCVLLFLLSLFGLFLNCLVLPNPSQSPPQGTGSLLNLFL